MGMFEKRRFKNFLVFAQDYKDDDPTTWKAMPGFDPKTTTMSAVFAHFNLDKNTIDFTGHALALYRLVLRGHFCPFSLNGSSVAFRI